MPIIAMNNIVKKYKEVKVLDDVSIEIENGEVIVLLGKNGSGKSTLIKLMLGFVKLRKNDSGIIKIDDLKIGYVPERISLPSFYRVKDYLKDYFVLKGSDFNYLELAEFFNLDVNKRLGELSKGMMQKVFLIQALDTNNDLYILDEVTNGLDDESIERLIYKLKELKDLNKTILIVTHYKELYDKIYTRKITFESSKIIEDCRS